MANVAEEDQLSHHYLLCRPSRSLVSLADSTMLTKARKYNHRRLRFVCSFVLCGQVSSLLLTPALRPFASVQCASPGRGGELIGMCGVHAM